MRGPRLVLCVMTALLFALLPAANAHVGSPDIYLQGNAGPYPIYVSIHPPIVVPGVAEIFVHTDATDVNSIQVTPLLLTGEGSKHSPTPDALDHNAAMPTEFHGNVWITSSGSWQVRFQVSGARGAGTIAIPVPSVAGNVRGITFRLGVLIVVALMLLVAGVVGIIGAAVRQASLPAAVPANALQRRRGRIAIAISSVLLLLLLFAIGHWWNARAASYGNNVYKPLLMQATLNSSGTLDLRLTDPGWLTTHRMDDLVPDHNHLMHLYMVRQSQMDVIFHLHPQQIAPGDFQLQLPSMPPGAYMLFADVVHADGFPETAIASLGLPPQTGRVLQGDDAMGVLPALDRATYTANSLTLADGYTMLFDRPANIPARTGQLLRFALLDSNGKPPADMADYMGMAGHAAILDDDFSVYAHIHPEGSVSMAAYMMANAGRAATSNAIPAMDMSTMQSAAVPNTVSFPYGFPKAGRYRIFVQMKHGNTIDTGAFDVVVN
jgi:hypothetical protein